MVEHDLAKVGVASSSLVFRSTGQFSTDLFSCPDLSTAPRTRGPVLPPLEGWGGYKKARIHVADVGSSLVFRSKGQFPTDLFSCPDLSTAPRTRGPVLPPLEGRGGYKKARIHVADVGSSLVFRSTGQFSTDLFSCPDLSTAPRTRGPVPVYCQTKNRWIGVAFVGNKSYF